MLGNAEAFGIVVADECQRQGIGAELLSRLVQIGRDEKLRQISADMLLENRGMQRTSEKLGFQFRQVDDASVVRAELNL